VSHPPDPDVGEVDESVRLLELGELVVHGAEPLERSSVARPAAERSRATGAAEVGYEAARRRIAELEAEWEAMVGPRRWATFRRVLSEVADHRERLG
jgi:hypothetical protein